MLLNHIINLESEYYPADNFTAVHLTDDSNHRSDIIVRDEAVALRIADDIADFVKIILSKEKTIKNFHYTTELGFHNMEKYYISMGMWNGEPIFNFISRGTIQDKETKTMCIQPINNKILDKLIELAENLSRVI